MRLFVTQNAEADLRSIWAHIAAENRTAADRMLMRMSLRFDSLIVHPELGRRRDDVAPNARSLVVGTYLIFYVVHDENIYITRVLHGARDLKNAYDLEPE